MLDTVLLVLHYGLRPFILSYSKIRSKFELFKLCKHSLDVESVRRTLSVYTEQHNAEIHRHMSKPGVAFETSSSVFGLFKNVEIYK